MSTTIGRSIRNAWRVGIKDYFKQLNGIGDTKYGRLVGTDSYGNKYYENSHEDEIHLRTRWVVYTGYHEISQVEPAWHFWLGYGVDTPPSETAPEHKTVRAFPDPNLTAQYYNKTGSRGAYVPYNTVKPKFSPWQPKVSERV